MKIETSGFLGMGRDVILQLCKLLSSDNSLKIIFGMCYEIYFWKNNWLFRLERATYLRTSYRYPNKRPYRFVRTLSGIQCNFSGGFGSEVVYQNTLITKGIFNWMIKIEIGTEEYSSIAFGFASSELDGNIGIDRTDGSCALRLHKKKGMKHENGRLIATLSGVKDGRYTIVSLETMGGVNVTDHSILAAEINMPTQTLSFFAKGKKIPHIVTHIPESLYMAVSGFSCRSDVPFFTSLAFRRLRSATDSLVVSKSWEYTQDDYCMHRESSYNNKYSYYS